MTATTADDLRANVIGAWTPQSYEARSIDGSNTIYPLGVDPQGIIMYTRYGYMSAQLMSSGRAPFSDDDMHSPRRDELAAAAGGYLSYAGPYTVVGDDLIAHDVAISLPPNRVGGTQYRAARLHGSLLELSPPQQDPHQWRTPQRQTRLAPRVIRGDG